MCSCGFYVYVKYPYLGVSPDAVVECKCCGKGLLEVKYLLCAQENSSPEVPEENQSFCCQECSNSKLQLKHRHSYYYQHQLQMFVINCKFVVLVRNRICILSAWFIWMMFFYTNQFLLQRTSSVTLFYQNFLESGIH